MDEYIKNRLHIEINKAYYIATRYKTSSTFAILYFEGALTVNDLGGFLRISDHILKIDANHYFINFAFSEQAAAFKASENLILTLDTYLNNQKSCIALDSFSTTKSPTIVIHRLMQILIETRKTPYSRIENENILNELFS